MMKRVMLLYKLGKHIFGMRRALYKSGRTQIRETPPEVLTQRSHLRGCLSYLRRIALQTSEGLNLRMSCPVGREGRRECQ